jgi:hypothetical protein
VAFLFSSVKLCRYELDLIWLNSERDEAIDAHSYPHGSTTVFLGRDYDGNATVLK